MTAQANAQEPSYSILDLIKLVLAVALLAAGIVGFYFYADYSLLYRTLAVFGVTLVSGGLFFTTQPGRSLWAFFQEARAEVRKVAWPTRQEVIHTTWVVVTMVLVVGLVLWLLDTLFLWSVRLLTGQGG